MRATIANSKAVGGLLVIKVYCPDELADFQEFVDGLELDDAAGVSHAVRTAQDRVDELMSLARAELAEPVSMRSVADPRQYPEEECDKAAQWVRERFAAQGFADARVVETSDGSKAVVGSRPCDDRGAPTVLLYAHYDVQPPLDEKAWRTPPFELTEVDGRWYGRGACDCKANILMHLTALRALDGDIPVNLKLVVEGSEEQGTGGLEALVPEAPSCSGRT